MKLQLFYFLKKGVLTMSKLKWTLLPLSIGVAILGLAGCNKNKNDANTLNVVYFNKGFGAKTGRPTTRKGSIKTNCFMSKGSRAFCF